MNFFILSTILIIGILIYSLSNILLPFVLGIIFAYLLAPSVKKLSHKINSRLLATLLPLFLFMTFIFSVLAIGIPFISEDIATFIKNMPIYAEWVEKALSKEGSINSLASNYGVNLDKEIIKEYIYTYSDQIAITALDTLQRASLGVMAIFDAISLIIITPLVTFYLLYDWPKFTQKCLNLLPKKMHKETTNLMKKINKSLSLFLRGQLTVSLMLGVFYGSALALSGLQLGFFIGLLGGFLSFIPFVGMAIGLVLSLILALMQYHLNSINPYIIIIAIFTIGQILEGFILTPKFIGKTTGLHPVWVIFAIMAGGELGGFLGMLIALPLATILTVILPIIIKKYTAELAKND